MIEAYYGATGPGHLAVTNHKLLCTLKYSKCEVICLTTKTIIRGTSANMKKTRIET